MNGAGRWALCLLVFFSQLGQLQMQPQLLLDHPDWPWQPALLAMACLRTLPWILLAWQLKRQAVPVLQAQAALAVALWGQGFPAGFCQPQSDLLLLISLGIGLFKPHFAIAGLALLFLPWRTFPDWQALLVLVVWRTAPAPWKPLLALQLGLRLLGAPALPLEWLVLGLLVPARQALLALLLGLGLWERNINKALLIPLQEAHLSLAALVWPAPFERWAATRGQAFGVTADDLQLADWLRGRPPTIVHVPLPEGRLQPYLTRRVLYRLSAHSDPGFPAGGESWLNPNLALGHCNLDVCLRRPEVVAVAPLAAQAGSCKPLQPLGPGSFLECRGPATLQDGPLQLTLPAGLHRLQLPVDNTRFGDQKIDLDLALRNLKLVGCQGPAEMTSNSLLAASLTFRLEGTQSLWIPCLGAQLSRPDLPPGWRDGSPLTVVNQLLEPGQQATLSCFLEVPEEGTAFACDFYWVAPQRRVHLLGRDRFTCRPRFPAEH